MYQLLVVWSFDFKSVKLIFDFMYHAMHAGLNGSDRDMLRPTLSFSFSLSICVFSGMLFFARLPLSCEV